MLWNGTVNNLEGHSPASVLHPARAAAQVLRRFWRGRRAVASLESVYSLCFMVAMVGGLLEVVNTLFVGDILDRAAHAVARDNALQDPADTEEKLIERAHEAIRAEVGNRLNPASLTIEIGVYDDPSAMLRGQLSQGANSRLGGDGGDMVAVRLSFTPPTPFRWIQQGLLSNGFAFQALAVARNERMIGLPGVGDVP